MNSLIATVTLNGKIECVTGLHIGATGGGYEIGGMDNPVIRDPFNGYPYIPGSSLKGKMRFLLEWEKGRFNLDGQPTASKDVEDPLNHPVLRIFGTSGGDELAIGPTRLVVRDAFPDENTKKKMRDLEEKQGLPKVEVKTEVSINRITGTAAKSGPRKMERVPVGSYFNFEMVYFLYHVDGLNKKDIELIDSVFTALRLLEDSALGGSGSRGSGQIRFLLDEPIVYKLEDYRNGTKKTKSQKEPNQLKLLSEYQKDFVDKLKQELGGL